MGCNETVEELPIKPEGVPEQAVEEPIEEPKPLVEDIPEKDLPIEMKIIKVTGENYKFVVDGEENPEIKVKVGEMIKIEFTSTDGFHDFVIDELNAKTERVTSGKSTVIEFVADKAGTFSYYCSVGNHRSAGMVGNFMVE